MSHLGEVRPFIVEDRRMLSRAKCDRSKFPSMT